jgi:non-heme chloroperoxidase
MFETKAARRQIKTSDGVTLSYLEAGTGKPFVMVHGWSQTAAQWAHQINHFSKTHRVIAIDLRGHGASENATFGYRVYRMAKDVRDVMEGLDLTGAVMMGHSMGCSVLWGLYDLFGAERIERFVFVDESPSLSSNPVLNDETRAQTGAIFTPEATYGTALALAADADGAVTTGFVTGMFTPDCPKDIIAASIALNMQLPRDKAAELVIDHVGNDWRDVMSRITLPALCIGGKISLVPWSSVVWQAEQMPHGRSVIFEPDEGGAHFMFLQNPEKFNRIVAEFLG